MRSNLQDSFISLVELKERKEEMLKVKVGARMVSADHMRDVLKLKESQTQLTHSHQAASHKGRRVVDIHSNAPHCLRTRITAIKNYCEQHEGWKSHHGRKRESASV